MGLNKHETTNVKRPKLMLCDYCGTPIELGIYSEIGDFCSITCENLEQADRAELKYTSMNDDFDDISLADQAEYRVDMAIDLEREKDL